MTAAFVSDVTRSVRRSMLHRLKGLGLGQDQLRITVSAAAKAAVGRTQVADMAAVLAAVGPVVAALEVAAPSDPALAAFVAVRDSADTSVQDLLAIP
jgi:hypothetical protein